MAPSEDPLERVMEELRRSRRYGRVSEPATRRLAEEALARSAGDARAAAKRTKRALHQIYGAFVPGRPRYSRMLAELARALEAGGAGGAEARRLLRDALAAHASTRERLPVLDDFYVRLWSQEGVGSVPERVLDLGCGLNPLAFPWMGLAGPVRYVAVDIEHELINFVGAALETLGAKGEARVQDLLDGAVAFREADVALALKLWPTLEQQRRGAAPALLERLPAPVLVVSFPRRSLGGSAKGFEAQHARDFESFASRTGRTLRRLVFPDELVYVLER